MVLHCPSHHMFAHAVHPSMMGSRCVLSFGDIVGLLAAMWSRVSMQTQFFDLLALNLLVSQMIL